MVICPLGLWNVVVNSKCLLLRRNNYINICTYIYNSCYIAIWSLFSTIVFLSLAQIQDQSKHKILNILAIVSVFIVNEWTMNYLLWGVPWLISGLTLIDTFAQKVYPFLGVAAASFLVYLIAALIAASYKSNKNYFMFIQQFHVFFWSLLTSQLKRTVQMIYHFL